MRRAAAIALLVCALAGCKKGAPNLCSSDLHCAAGFVCDPATGACRCGSDAACQQTEQCNAAGFCQPKLRCAATADCAADSICDSQSGSCISSQTCTLDVQCALGNLCNQNDFTCEPGCRAAGDCPLGMVCRDCPPGTPPDQCTSGKQCVLGPCDSQLSCPYGDFCLPDATGEHYCTPDPQNRPFCQSCVRQGGSVSFCEGYANYCLIDTSKPFPQAFYCGIDCSEGQDCPNGYECRDVRIVTAQTCDVNAGLSSCPATGGNPTCDPAKNHPRTDGQPGIVNDDCEAVSPPLIGAVCNPSTKSCTAQCNPGAETATTHFCSCIRDSDCPQDACVSGNHDTCSISGKPCLVGRVPDDCQSTSAIFCVKVSDPRLGPLGYCRIGQNCAPAEGFTCDRLRAGN